MAVCRLVHVSDIHFGQERNGTKVEHDDVRRQLLADAAGLARERGDADLILVTGDIAYSGKRHEYHVAGAWLDQLAAAVGCKETDVRVVPGNHDCDHSELNRACRTVHRSIRGGEVAAAYADLEDAAKGREEANWVLPKFKAYREFAASYDSDFENAACPSWKKDMPIADGIALRFIGLNSVQVSDEEDDLGLLVLGNSQYIWPEDPSAVPIVAMHHPFDWLKDRAEARRYLCARARVIMVGHEHDPRIHKLTDQFGNEWIEIFSGAANPPRGGPYQHAYNWIEMELRTNAAGTVLAVTICPRIWNPQTTRFDADRQRLDGRDWAEFQVACDRLRPNTVERTMTPNTERPSASAEPMPPAAAVQEAALAKLKFLFWRHLDWQQRLAVLVEADVLPRTADRPLPQTMERLALEQAAQAGKLGAVWDAMMRALPEQRREPNPFTK